MVDGSKYKSWRRLFLDICKGEKVLGYINGKSKPSDNEDEEWDSIVSGVKLWFYSSVTQICCNLFVVIIALQKIYETS